MKHTTEIKGFVVVQVADKKIDWYSGIYGLKSSAFTRLAEVIRANQGMNTKFEVRIAHTTIAGYKVEEDKQDG